MHSDRFCHTADAFSALFARVVGSKFPATTPPFSPSQTAIFAFRPRSRSKTGLHSLRSPGPFLSSPRMKGSMGEVVSGGGIVGGVGLRRGWIGAAEVGSGLRSLVRARVEVGWVSAGRGRERRSVHGP